VALSQTQVQLSWTPSAGATGYHVDEWNGSAWMDVADVAASIQSSDVSALSPGTTYYFRIEAYNANGSSHTSFVSATTLLPF
jgi:hypothetical protein